MSILAKSKLHSNITSQVWLNNIKKIYLFLLAYLEKHRDAVSASSERSLKLHIAFKTPKALKSDKIPQSYFYLHLLPSQNFKKSYEALFFGF